jgi:hypothetical protein
MRNLVPLAVLFAAALFSACDENDDLADRVQTISQDVQDRAAKLGDEIDARVREPGFDPSTLDAGVKRTWNDNCRQLADSESNADAKKRVMDVCGDLQRSLNENGKEGIERARRKLQELRTKG